jgi:hypothetical protein
VGLVVFAAIVADELERFQMRARGIVALEGESTGFNAADYVIARGTGGRGCAGCGVDLVPLFVGDFGFREGFFTEEEVGSVVPLDRL